MKLLIITQKINKQDPILGFFHNWLTKFSSVFENITVICLEAGEYNLPANIKVLSLGKPTQGWSASGGEKFLLKIKALLRFSKYLWRERNNYDTVFVHMNQEYILLAGWWWKLAGKKVYTWRNHQAGSWLTDLAASFCTKVFCTSKFSYTAKYKKTVLMPVGVDTSLFQRQVGVQKIPNAILFLARMSPIKNPHLLIEALKQLKNKGLIFTANFFGDPLPKDEVYYQSLQQEVKADGLQSMIRFHKGLPNTETVKVYNQHAIFVNLSPSGMYDKTIFEAMSTESLVVVSNDNLKDLIEDMFIFANDNINQLVSKLTFLLSLSTEQKEVYGRKLRTIVQNHHSLDQLVTKLKTELNP